MGGNEARAAGSPGDEGSGGPRRRTGARRENEWGSTTLRRGGNSGWKRLGPGPPSGGRAVNGQPQLRRRCAAPASEPPPVRVPCSDRRKRRSACARVAKTAAALRAGSAAPTPPASPAPPPGFRRTSPVQGARSRTPPAGPRHQRSNTENRPSAADTAFQPASRAGARAVARRSTGRCSTPRSRDDIPCPQDRPRGRRVQALRSPTHKKGRWPRPAAAEEERLERRFSRGSLRV